MHITFSDITEKLAKLTLSEQMMKACKDDVYFIHSFKWPKGTFDRIQDFKGENASKNIQTMVKKHWM